MDRYRCHDRADALGRSCGRSDFYAYSLPNAQPYLYSHAHRDARLQTDESAWDHSPVGWQLNASWLAPGQWGLCEPSNLSRALRSYWDGFRLLCQVWSWTVCATRFERELSQRDQRDFSFRISWGGESNRVNRRQSTLPQSHNISRRQHRENICSYSPSVKQFIIPYRDLQNPQQCFRNREYRFKHSLLQSASLSGVQLHHQRGDRGPVPTAHSYHTALIYASAHSNAPNRRDDGYTRS